MRENTKQQDALRALENMAAQNQDNTFGKFLDAVLAIKNNSVSVSVGKRTEEGFISYLCTILEQTRLKVFSGADAVNVRMVFEDTYNNQSVHFSVEQIDINSLVFGIHEYEDGHCTYTAIMRYRSIDNNVLDYRFIWSV